MQSFDAGDLSAQRFYIKPVSYTHLLSPILKYLHPIILIRTLDCRRGRLPPRARLPLWRRSILKIPTIFSLSTKKTAPASTTSAGQMPSMKDIKV